MRRPEGIWVVGGSSGIGQGISDRLRFEGIGQKVWATGLDVDVSYQSAIDEFTSKCDVPIDTIVYSVGFNHLDWSADIDLVVAEEMYNVNVLGLLRVLRACPDAQRVIVVGSDAAWRPMRTSVAYCASKAALHMAVSVIARERGGEEFSIVTVAPGKVGETPMTTYVDKRSAALRPDIDHIAYQQGQIPGGSFASKGDVAEVVASLIQLNTHYINGATVAVNGGRS
jgi:NAD(P)-dependent dehydrogenase (short-subunit alcohol dehydrogenase family)